MLIGVGVFVGMIIYAEPQVRADYVMNLFVTVLSLGATALIFDELNRKRSVDDLKRQLVMDAGSLSNEVAKNAVHQLRRRGWLEGEEGILKGADLLGAHMQEVNLCLANLQQADLMQINLQKALLNYINLHKANLLFANLQEATLAYSNLQDARVQEVDLRRADLSFADLQEANLLGADLRGTELREANLQGANLDDVNRQGDLLIVSYDDRAPEPQLDKMTILPDGTHWTPETEMQRFTDPEHPDFWRSDSPLSPAYRGKSEE